MKILAVDDDPIILELLTQFIETVGGHELTTALSGHDALELIHAHSGAPFECFMLDVQMPQMDGIALTRALRQIEQHADTPVLMLTAMSDKRYIDAAFASGASDYVTKPFEVAELKARLTLIEDLVTARASRTKKIFAAKSLGAQSEQVGLHRNFGLHDQISIYDVENVIDYPAMENYISQLARGSMFGSTAFAFSIRKIEEHFAAMSAHEFAFMVSDIAEIISDTLTEHQFLMAYAGSGIFVCVTESGWRPSMQDLTDAINLSLAQTELYDNSGQRLFVRVSAGDAVRLIWKSQTSVMEAVSAAYTSAEAASAAHERTMKDLWLVPQSA